jgi:hypothetical protein
VGHQCHDIKTARIENWKQELFNLLINPLEHEFALRWHRDDVREDACEDDEREALNLWHHGVITAILSLHGTDVSPGTMEYVRSAKAIHRMRC